jgi:hypothetical protein
VARSLRETYQERHEDQIPHGAHQSPSRLREVAWRNFRRERPMAGVGLAGAFGWHHSQFHLGVDGA